MASTAEYVVKYDPLDNNVGYSALIALIPIVSLFVLLFLTKVIYAAVAALAGCILVATLLYHMPVRMAFLAMLHGMLYGFWPICLIISAAIYLYDMSVVTGNFDVLKYTLVSITKDKRCLALILAYAFSGVIEGGSGFSTPIALAGSMLVGVGFTPGEAAVAALLGNTIPVCNGGVGIPTITLASVTAIDPVVLAGAIQRLMLPFSILMPWLIVFSVSNDKGALTGIKRTAAVWPACLLVSVCQTAVSFAVATFNGPSVASIASYMVSLVALAGLLKFVWHPKDVIMPAGMEAEALGHREAEHEGVVAMGVGGGEVEMPRLPPAPMPAGQSAPADLSASAHGAIARGLSTSFATPSKGQQAGKHAAHHPAGRTVDDEVIYRHQSLKIERRHPIIEEQEAEERARQAAGRPAAGAGKDEAGQRTAEGVGAAAGAAGEAAAPVSARATRRVFVMRRLEYSEAHKRRLDSSSVATALFPHSLEYAIHLGPTGRRDRRNSAAEGGVQPATPQGPGLFRRTLDSALATFRGRSGSAGFARPPVDTAAPAAVPGGPAAGGAAAEAGAAALGATGTAGLHSSEQSSTSVSPVTTGQNDATVPAAAVSGTKATTTVAAAAHAGATAPHADGGGHGDAHAKEAAGLTAEVQVHYDELHPPTTTQILLAWFPWVFLCIAVAVWGSAGVQGVATDKEKTGLGVATQLIKIAGLHNQVYKPDPQDPAGPHGHLVAAVWTLNLLGAAGVCIYLVCLVTLAVYRVHPVKAAHIYYKSISRMALSFLTICVLMAFGYVLKASGQDVTLGMAAAKSGKGYPFVGSLIGFLGVALTGSATSTSVIFGSLQVVAATELGINPVLMASSNMVAGCIGHIISTASMVVAGVSTGLPGKGIGPIITRVIVYALSLVVIQGIWATIVANAIPGFMPTV